MGTCAVQVTRARVPRFKEEVEVPLTFTSSRGGDGATGREIKKNIFSWGRRATASMKTNAMKQVCCVSLEEKVWAEAV